MSRTRLDQRLSIQHEAVKQICSKSHKRQATEHVANANFQNSTHGALTTIKRFRTGSRPVKKPAYSIEVRPDTRLSQLLQQFISFSYAQSCRRYTHARSIRTKFIVWSIDRCNAQVTFSHSRQRSIHQTAKRDASARLI